MEHMEVVTCHGFTAWISDELHGFGWQVSVRDQEPALHCYFEDINFYFPLHCPTGPMDWNIPLDPSQHTPKLNP